MMLKSLTLEPAHDEITDGVGRIVRAIDYWVLSWTTQEPGYIQVDHTQPVVSPESAVEAIREIIGRCV